MVDGDRASARRGAPRLSPLPSFPKIEKIMKFWDWRLGYLLGCFGVLIVRGVHRRWRCSYTDFVPLLSLTGLKIRVWNFSFWKKWRKCGVSGVTPDRWGMTRQDC